MEKTALKRNWLGRKGLQLLQTLTEAEQENVKCLRDYFTH